MIVSSSHLYILLLLFTAIKQITCNNLFEKTSLQLFADGDDQGLIYDHPLP